MSATQTSGRALQVKSDLFAAATVTLVGIPQCLAYAMMSGIPPAYGLATAAVPGFVAALVGKSPHLVTGPTNTTGLLILGALTPFLGADGLIGENGLAIVATLTLMAGLVRIVAGLLGGANLVRFLPESVLAGFAAGAGILIVVMQLDEGLGMSPVSDSGLEGELAALWGQIQAGVRPAWPAILLTVGTAGAIVLGKRLAPKLPMALIVVAGGIALAKWSGMDASSGLALVQDRSLVPNAWPVGAMPVFELPIIVDLFFPALAIALLGTLELAVSARADGAQPDMTRELHAQGFANVVGAFVSAFPASASLTRSALLKMGAAQTRLAAALAALFCVPVLFFAGEWVGYIPQASLAGVLLVTAWRMANIERLKRMFATAQETRILLLVTLVATLILPLEWAVFLGAGLGIVLHIQHSSTPRIRFVRPEGYRLIPIEDDDCIEVLVVEVSGELYFAAIEPLRKQVQQSVRCATRYVVFDLSNAHRLRYAALEYFEELNRSLGGIGVDLILSGVNTEFQSVLSGTKSKLVWHPCEAGSNECLRRCLHDLGCAPQWPPPK